MKSVLIIPRDKKEFGTAFSLLVEFTKERKRLTTDDDEDIGFAFLMKAKDDIEEVQVKVNSKKSGN